VAGKLVDFRDGVLCNAKLSGALNHCHRVLERDRIVSANIIAWEASFFRGGTKLKSALEREIVRFAQSLPAERASHTEKFFRDQGLNLEELLKDVRAALTRPADVLLVSTVVTGLAGSTSDLDIIGILEGDEPAQSVSLAVFSQNRRLGLKAYSNLEYRMTVQQVGDWVNLVRSSAPEILPSPGTPIKPIEFERIVNGYSPSSGTPFASDLPTLSGFRLAFLWPRFQAALSMAHLGMAAGRESSATGYAITATMAALDFIMTAVGRVQFSYKWTYLRWAKFQSAEVPQEVMLARQEAEALRRELFSGSNLRRLIDLLDNLSKRVEDLFELSNRAQYLTLPLRRTKDQHPYLQNGVLWFQSGGVRVTHQKLLTQFDGLTWGDVQNLPRTSADLLLTLVQRGAYAIPLASHMF
jgi:hypothetical protein